MKVYIDIGNTAIKILNNNKIRMIDYSLKNLESILIEFSNHYFVFAISNKDKKNILKTISQHKIKYKNVLPCDIKNICSNNIDQNEVGIDILLSTLYFSKKNGVLIINGTCLVTVLILESKIHSVTIGIGTSYETNFINKILKTNLVPKYENILGNNTENAVNLNNFIRIYGLIEYYKNEYNISNFVLSGNSFRDSNLINIFNLNNVMYVDNLVLKMLQK